LPELRQGRRVEGPGGDAREAERLQTSHHLAGSLVGEGDHEDAPGVDGAGRDRVCSPVADDPRLPRSGAGVDDERPAGDSDGLDLGRIEAHEKVRGVIRQGRILARWGVAVSPDLPCHA